MTGRATSKLHQLPFGHGAVLGLAAGAVLALAASLGAFSAFDLKLADWRYRLRGIRPAPARLTIVEVDDATAHGYGQWPLPRSAYALLVDVLDRGGASAIGLDLLFIGNSTRDSLSDRALAAVTRDCDRLVNAINFLPRTAGSSGDLEGRAGALDDLIRHGRPLGRQHVVSAAHAALPFVELLAGSDAVGHTALAVDRDGVVRRLPLFVRFGDWIYPALSLRVVETAARHDARLPQFESDRQGLLLHQRGHTRRVPIDPIGNAAPLFYGDERAFPDRVSMLRLLQWDRAGDTAAIARAVRDRVVLVGVTALAEVATDVGATPFAETTPLVFVHANAVAAMLEGRFLSWIPMPGIVLLLLVLGAILGAVNARLHLGISAAVTLAAVVLLAVADQAAFVLRDLDVPATALLLLPPLTWTAVEGLRRRSSERAAFVRAKELDVARSIQRKLLPQDPPRFLGLDVFGLNVPTEEVGGDYYDWIPLASNRLAIAVGDVTGHGIPAALLMAHLRATLHAEVQRADSPAEVVTAMNRTLEKATDSGKGATFFLASFEANGREFRYCNAGHNFPLLIHDGKLRELGATGIPIAMLDDFPWGEERATLEPGDTLVLFSDGVPEWQYRDEFFGDERWQALAIEQSARDVSAREMTETMLKALERFARGNICADDVTIVVVRATGAGPTA